MRLPARWAWVRPALIAFAAAQLLFWGFAAAVETHVAPRDPARSPAFTGLAMDSEPDPSIPDARLLPAPGGRDEVHAPGSGRWVLLRTRFTPAPGERWALMSSTGGDAYRLYLNGVAVGSSGGGWPDRRASARTPRLFVFEPHQLRPGENRLDLVVVRSAGHPQLRGVFLGPWEELRGPFSWRGMVRDHLLAAAAGIGLWAGLLALMLARGETATRWLGVMLIAWFVWTGLVVARDFPAPASTWWSLHMLAGLLVLAASAAFGSAALGARFPRPSHFLWLWGLAAAGLAPALAWDFAAAYPLAMVVSMVVSLGVFAVLLAVMLRRLPEVSDNWLVETIAVTVALTAGVVDTIDELVPLTPPGFPSNGISMSYTPFACAVLALAFIWSLAAKALEAERSVRRANQDLSRKVAEKERELADYYARQQALARHEALTHERQRILRDMHDGIGGQLTGLILQAKARKLTGGRLVSALEDSLSDLRLMVESLDQSEATLEAALGAFRGRIEPRCEAAGARLVWRIGDVGSTRDLGPAAILQIYRLLQEACANALRHAAPTAITVTLSRPLDAPELVEISLADDGAGFDPATVKGGVGLRSMRLRAERIGGRLDFASGPDGTRVSLRFPG
ncbi:MAG TPA: ATP-binding protein [Caulobacter sp.]|nr:ATP-binding protein [Caulobacter sp.]